MFLSPWPTSAVTPQPRAVLRPLPGRDATKPSAERRAAWGSAFAVGDAKHWDEQLDVPLKKASNQFTHAYGTIEDVPEGQTREEVRRRTLAVLVDESNRALREAGRYKEELRLKG